MGSGSIALAGGSLEDVLFVPEILMNLLSIYYIFQSSSGKKIEFSPHDVVIFYLHDFDLILVTGSVDSASHLYRFDGFESFDGIGSYLVAHSDSMSIILHEIPKQKVRKEIDKKLRK